MNLNLYRSGAGASSWRWQNIEAELAKVPAKWQGQILDA